MTKKGKRAAHTPEFKLEALRLVQGGQAKAVVAKVLGIPEPTLACISPMQFENNWLEIQLKKAA